MVWPTVRSRFHFLGTTDTKRYVELFAVGGKKRVGPLAGPRKAIGKLHHIGVVRKDCSQFRAPFIEGGGTLCVTTKGAEIEYLWGRVRLRIFCGDGCGYHENMQPKLSSLEIGWLFGNTTIIRAERRYEDNFAKIGSASG
ncbi:MAG: hypothetical protein A2289_05425 [Deltaproteobacteria bacterium RIFOXYA12_FULL_58_15]|nr:MAG: hypothetical protein A2289_05425 [Deltaproteobacteria bacterium RIFOXYA12_FULL_58_15]